MQGAVGLGLHSDRQLICIGYGIGINEKLCYDSIGRYAGYFILNVQVIDVPAPSRDRFIGKHPEPDEDLIARDKIAGGCKVEGPTSYVLLSSYVDPKRCFPCVVGAGIVAVG